MSMNIINIAEEIDKQREAQGITIEQLCTHAGIARATYYHWLEGRSSPKACLLSLVMDVLNLEVVVRKRA